MSLLCMKDICKSFNGIPVLKQVQLTIEKGEVHALLGENGAGKSTLMNILAGVFPADSGEVEFNEKKIRKMTIQQSEKLGIAFVHQELNLFNDLKVYENIFLMKEYKKKPGILDKKRMIRETQQLFTELGVEIEPEEKVENLKTSQKQLLEISKALFFQAKLLILDEPTTSLNNDEVEHLFQIIRRLKEKGTAFIFISHKMPEIFRIADRYTVLRNGEFIKSGKLSEITQEEATGLMVGEKFSHQEVYQKRELGENVLELNRLSGHGFSNVNLTVKKGSIVGLTGLQGSGSSELLQGLFGAVTVTGGTLKVSGKECRIHSIQGAMKAGIAMLASNRKENSVIPDMIQKAAFHKSRRFQGSDHVIKRWKPAKSFSCPLVKYRGRYSPVGQSDTGNRRRSQSRNL